MKSKHYLHGGDLDAAAALYGLDRDKIWDFSGNINPLGTSPKAREAMRDQIDCISTYPDRQYKSLKQVVGAYSGASPEHVLVGNGTSELISLVIHELGSKQVMTLAPTYSEYEREITLCGGKLDYFTLKAEDSFKLSIADLFNSLSSGYDLLIICNPNNPTSTVLSTDELRHIVSYCKEKGIFVMVDETYIEFCDDPQVVSAIPLVAEFANLLVLRGISKFFSAPGLRFGYGICSDLTLQNRLVAKQNPWSVNILATIGVEAMLQDQEYIHSTHQLFVTERNRIVAELLPWDKVHVFIPQANFVLLKLKNTALIGNEIMNELIAKNMLIRDASSFPSLDESYIRFCFLAPEQNDKLLVELRSLLN